MLPSGGLGELVRIELAGRLHFLRGHLQADRFLLGADVLELGGNRVGLAGKESAGLDHERRGAAILADETALYLPVAFLVGGTAVHAEELAGARLASLLHGLLL